MPATILLVDDHAIVRQGIATMLRQHDNLKVIGEAADGREAVGLAASLKPDVIVMDIGLPEISGDTATRTILSQNPNAKIVILSSFADRRNVLAALQAGALGYVVKDSVVEELVEAIGHVQLGKRYVSSALASTMLEGVVATNGPAGGGQLTQREREVLQLLADGKAMKQAAMELRISTKTVETHRRAIMEKLQLFSVAELTKHAIREGLTTLN